jgi:hypothetical protein
VACLSHKLINLKDLEPGTNIELSTGRSSAGCVNVGIGRVVEIGWRRKFGEQRADRGTVAGYERGRGWPES